MLMGAAIPVMHYTGMAAASFRSTALPVDLTHSVKISSIGVVGIGGVAFMTLSLAILTSLVDRRFSAQSLELHQSDQRYRELVDSAKVILWRGSLDGTSFSYVNHEAQILLGYPIENWTCTSAFWTDHLHAEDRELAESCCRGVAESRGPERFEHRMIAADGRVVWLRTSVSLVSGNGEAKQLAGAMTDITDRKLAEEAAEEASRTKSGLLAEINGLHAQLKRENARMSSELEITQRLQQMMLPARRGHARQAYLRGEAVRNDRISIDRCRCWPRPFRHQVEERDNRAMRDAIMAARLRANSGVSQSSCGLEIRG